eukprot:scaffold1829_cov289-Chaetoceros_neogracile.AAC.4
MTGPGRKHVVVVVMGDLGRSPRMSYHALSLLEHGHCVSLIGYEGEDIMPQLKLHGGLLQVIRFNPYTPPSWIRKYALPLYYMFRIVGLAFGLTVATTQIQGDPDCVLVQNPPSLPLLMIAYCYCLIKERSAKKKPGFVIDWHNLGFTMLKPKSMIRQLAYENEKMMSPYADGHLCVTKAMKEWLIGNFGIDGDKIFELYDRPPEFFRPTKAEVMHDLMKRLKSDMEKQSPCLRVEETNRTLFTEVLLQHGNRQIVERDDEDRPVLIVSSTSWTADEDFSILLRALGLLDRTIKENNIKFPRVVVIVTGKGPQKEMYKEQISQMHLEKVSILTLWLEASDYPKLLGCADLGVSLHTSTSDLDLPMKVLDMFGCEVPVCAVKFGCLDELVQDGVNGRVFSQTSGLELSEQFLHLLIEKRGDDKKITGDLAKFRGNIRGMTRWRENWKDQAHDMIMDACPDILQSHSKED